MNKEFVPYTESLEMKQLGFDEPCFGRWLVITQWETPTGEIKLQIGVEAESYDKRQTKAPTYSQAFRWFREHQDWPIESWIQPYLSDEPRQHEAFYWRRGEKVSVGVFSTYDEAQLGLLRKLIELFKNK